MTKPTKLPAGPTKTQISWASTHSDQNLCCPHEEILGPLLPIEHTVKADQPGCTCHFVGFVMQRLSYCFFLG